MSNITRAAFFTFGYVAAGLIAAVAVGMLTYGRQSLDFPDPLLSLLLVGLAAALTYAAAQMYGYRYALLAIALFLLTRGAFIPGSIIASAIYSVLVGFALLAGAYWQKSLTRLRFGRFLSMGLMVAAGYALMTLLLMVIWSIPAGLGAFWRQAFLGAKLGVGMGLGFELIDLIGPRPRRRFLSHSFRASHRSKRH